MANLYWILQDVDIAAYSTPEVVKSPKVMREVPNVICAVHAISQTRANGLDLRSLCTLYLDLVNTIVPLNHAYTFSSDASMRRKNMPRARRELQSLLMRDTLQSVIVVSIRGLFVFITIPERPFINTNANKVVGFKVGLGLPLSP